MAPEVNERALREALRGILPAMDPEQVTLKVVLGALAARLEMAPSDLRAFKTTWKPRVKELIAEMIDLCGCGGDNENAEDENATRGLRTRVSEGNDDDDEDGEEDDVVRGNKRRRRVTPTAKTAVKQRNRNVIEDESDEEGDAFEQGEDEEDAESEQSGGDSEEEDVVTPVKKRARTKAAPRKKAEEKPRGRKKSTSPPAKRKNDRPAESEGLASLKEMARVAGLLNPSLYGRLKKADSEEAQEEILRDRLREGGIRLSGRYPKRSEIADVKRKKTLEKELDGIDTSAIISTGRARRAASQRASYAQEEVAVGSDGEEGGENHEDHDGEDVDGARQASEDESSEASFRLHDESSDEE